MSIHSFAVTRFVSEHFAACNFGSWPQIWCASYAWHFWL